MAKRGKLVPTTRGGRRKEEGGRRRRRRRRKRKREMDFVILKRLSFSCSMEYNLIALLDSAARIQ